MKTPYTDINTARGYYDRLWSFTNTNDKIIALERYWGARGKLELLRTPIPKKEAIIERTTVQKNTTKTEKKAYNHLSKGIIPTFRTPTEELEIAEDEWFAENYELFCDNIGQEYL